MSWTDILSGFAAAASAVAAVAAYLASRKTNETATRLGRIEDARHKAELLPQFQLSSELIPDGRTQVTVKLVGPSSLLYLDAITISVRDDNDDRDVRDGGSDQIWGPVRLARGIDNASDDGRSIHAPKKMWITDTRKFLFERTTPPRDSGDEAASWWEHKYRNEPIRLSIKGHRDESTWEVAAEVDQGYSPLDQIH